MYKHKLSKKQAKHSKKNRKWKERVEAWYLKKEFPSFDFYRSLQSNLSQVIKQAISNVELKELGLEKVSIK